MPERRRLAANAVVYGLGLLLLGTVAAGVVELITRPRTQLNRVIIGAKDEVYYYHSATPEEARSLGEALKATGFFNGRGTTVLLSKGTAGTSVSFVLNDGGWDHPETIYSFEEIGRRIAGSIGGFPITVRLIDSRRVLHKELAVGKAIVAEKDAVYYYGTATPAQAAALGQALQTAGYLQGNGASVVLSRDGEPKVSFVVNTGVWDRPEAVAGFENLVRHIAPAIGGLPVRLALLDSEMAPRKTVTVE